MVSALVFTVGMNSLHCLLMKDYQVIALDLPGFGRSSKHAHLNYGLDDQAERVEKFLDRLGIEECCIVGNSMGGNSRPGWREQTSSTVSVDVVAIAPAANPKLVPWGATKVGFLSRPCGLAVRPAHRPLDAQEHAGASGPGESMNTSLQTLNVYRKNPLAIRAFLAATAVITDRRMQTQTFNSRILAPVGSQRPLSKALGDR